MKPTPRPWVAIWHGAYIVPEEDKGKPVGGSVAPREHSNYARVIATVGGIQDREPLIPTVVAQANSELIVRAVNNFDSLLAACEAAAAAFGRADMEARPLAENWADLRAAAESCRAAIAKAKGS